MRSFQIAWMIGYCYLISLLNSFFCFVSLYWNINHVSNNISCKINYLHDDFKKIPKKNIYIFNIFLADVAPILNQKTIGNHFIILRYLFCKYWHVFYIKINSIYHLRTSLQGFWRDFYGIFVFRKKNIILGYWRITTFDDTKLEHYFICYSVALMTVVNKVIRLTEGNLYKHKKF